MPLGSRSRPRRPGSCPAADPAWDAIQWRSETHSIDVRFFIFDLCNNFANQCKVAVWSRVDLDVECPIVCPILHGLMGIWQKGLCKWAQNTEIQARSMTRLASLYLFNTK